MKRQYAIKVTMSDGEENYVCDGIGCRVSRFHSKQAAQHQADFLKMGLDAGDQVAVVHYPTTAVMKAEGYLV